MISYSREIPLKYDVDVFVAGGDKQTLAPELRFFSGAPGNYILAGLAFALMFTVVNLGSMILQGAINDLGKTTIAAHTVARKISELCMMTLSTLANAMATFAGQNHGAGRYDRIKQGLRSVLFCGFGIATVLIFMIYTIGEKLVILLSGSSTQELIDTAVFYLRFDLPFYFVLAVLLITRTTLQGMGAKFVPIIASLMELILKIITARFLAVRLGYLGIAMCEPITWIAGAIFIITVFVLRIKKYESNVADKNLHRA